MNRLLTNILTTELAVKRYFSAESLQRITDTVSHAESMHNGELRVAVESHLPFGFVLRGGTSRTRAIELFSKHRIWDTEHNNGVLLYLLIAERRFEIIADRGVSKVVTQSEWDNICRTVETYFCQKHFEQGMLEGIKLIAELLGRHFPKTADDRDELPNTAIIT